MTLVLCLGNDILRDDGVGWAIADALEARLRESSAGGLDAGGRRNPGVLDPGLRRGDVPSESRVPVVIPAEAGIQPIGPWTPAFAGVTSRVPNPESRSVVVKRSALSGFYLLDELTGWERAIVVDAVQTGLHPPGTVLSFPFAALGTEAGPSPHAVGLPTVVRLGRQSGVPLPEWIHVVAIEVDDMESFVEGLTPSVEAAVPEAVDVITSVLAHLTVSADAPAGGTPLSDLAPAS